MFIHLSPFLSEVKAEVIGGGARASAPIAGEGSFVLFPPLLTAVSVFTGGVGLVLLLVAFFSYFLGAGDEEKMSKSHNLLFSALGFIFSSILLFGLAKIIG